MIPSECCDADLERYVADANPMTLLGVLHQLTGDPSLAALPLDDVPTNSGTARAMTDPAAVATVRASTVAYLRARRDHHDTDRPVGPRDRLLASLSLAVGTPIPAEAEEFCIEELALERIPRRYELRHRAPADTSFHVAVVGAGIGGINAAINLAESGIAYTVIEKNDGVGGCWHDNRYPGCRVDIPSRAYSHTFGLEYPWEHWFAPQAENNDYLRWCVERFGVADRIRLRTEVTTATWDDETCRWHLELRGADGTRETLTANVVISAVGFLSRPKFPVLDGLGTFSGPAFHTAWWDTTVEPAGRHVGVIGTGCSGMQLVPELVRQGATVTVFQRRPSWVFENPVYRSPLPAGVRWLDRNLPLFRNVEKFRAIWLVGDHLGARPFFVDPDWDDPHSLSAANHQARTTSLAYLQRKLGHRPDLLAASIPDSPAMASRPVIDNGWLDALAGPAVELVTEPIARIVPDGVETASGRQVGLDVLVYATGFETSRFLWPMTVTGRNGTLTDLWAHDGARAYLGITVPGFPNLFCIYGPNTNSNQGTLPTMGSELQTRYAIQCIEELFRTGAGAIDLRREAYDTYNARLDEGLARTIFADPRLDTYYVNEHGRSSSQTCWSSLEYWSMTRRPDFADYELSGRLLA